jgi:hypothetical protein
MTDEFDKLQAIAAETDAAAILAALEAWKLARDGGELEPRHAGVLIGTIVRLRGEFITSLEREAEAWRAAGDKGDINEHLAPMWEGMRKLWLSDIEKITSLANGDEMRETK